MEEVFHAQWTEHYKVILPKGYSPTHRYGAVYFLHGKGGDRHLVDALGMCAELDRMVDTGATPFVVIAPDGGNGYWMNGALTQERWGDLVTHDLIRDAEKKYSLISNQAGRIIAGISMGGHGAIQLTLNNPGIYGAVAAHSPVFRTQAQASQDFYYQFGTGIEYMKRDPFSMMQVFGKRFNVPIYMDMGGSDPWITNTRNFLSLLQAYGYTREFHVGEDAGGGHEMGYWQYHLSSYMRWYSAHLPRVN